MQGISEGDSPPQMAAYPSRLRARVQRLGFPQTTTTSLSLYGLTYMLGIHGEEQLRRGFAASIGVGEYYSK